MTTPGEGCNGCCGQQPDPRISSHTEIYMPNQRNHIYLNFCSSQDYLNPNHMTRREYTFSLVHPFLVLIVRILFQELPQYAAKKSAAFASWNQLKSPADKTPMNKIPKVMTETVPDQRDSFLALGERCIPNYKV